MEHRNIYQMYADNNDKVGFYVRRDSWVNCYAKVIEVDGKIEGALNGEPPYYSSQRVKCDLYDLKSNRKIKYEQELTCPGTYGYREVNSDGSDRG